jgi:ArpU family phage transcriptional regulator
VGKTKRNDRQASILPAIDEERTQENIERFLEEVRIYRQIGFVRREVKTTQGYTLRQHGPTNVTSDQTADAAIWNADTESRIKRNSENLDRAIKCLRKRQREVIEKRYLDIDAADDYDYQLSEELLISTRTFRRIKYKALYTLAFMLDLEVLAEEAAS